MLSQACKQAGASNNPKASCTGPHRPGAPARMPLCLAQGSGMSLEAPGWLLLYPLIRWLGSAAVLTSLAAGVQRLQQSSSACAAAGADHASQHNCRGCAVAGSHGPHGQLVRGIHERQEQQRAQQGAARQQQRGARFPGAGRRSGQAAYRPCQGTEQR